MVTINGLKGKTYIDKTDQSAQHVETAPSISITSETDRVYKSYKPDGVIVVEEDGKARFEILRDTLGDVVVWNPWSEKAKGMSDFGPADGYKQMGMSHILGRPQLSTRRFICYIFTRLTRNTVCVEAGSVAGWQKLDPGDTFEGGQMIKSLL